TKVASPNVVGNTTGDSWSGIVMRSAPDPELAYYLFALLATEPKQRFFAARLVNGIDPARTYQIPKPLGDGSIDDYTAQGWDAHDALEYTEAFFHTFGNDLQLPYLRIPGSERYWSALDVRISEFMTGEAATAEATLTNLADDWNAITDDLDRETQLQSYLISLGLPVAPPSD
ncbi:MAG TPA: hypothetical protein VFX03_16725, partial [Thermomicrobiales bacterium]|nr:hypothetical protein [Thermomicrobiales bacterium]